MKGEISLYSYQEIADPTKILIQISGYILRTDTHGTQSSQVFLGLPWPLFDRIYNFFALFIHPSLLSMCPNQCNLDLLIISDRSSMPSIDRIESEPMSSSGLILHIQRIMALSLRCMRLRALEAKVSEACNIVLLTHIIE